ncbi:Ig-like domain-containing protein, partial [Rhizobium mesoamericanum]|uniref:Ig-like domain-containing protein n=1 Tax=Rhizobium mesoamericanum TaxID=1079800 RepID=UPI00055BA190
DGAHSLTVSNVDAAGNEGSPTAPFAFTVDTVAPSQSTVITAVNDDQPAVTGSVANNGYTNDLSPQVAGTISAPLGTGETVVVLRDGAVIGTATVSGTSWTFQDGGLADGSVHTYTARVEDAAGNRGGISSGYTINIDASAPTQTVAISTVVDDAAPGLGSVANGGTTNDSQPELQGTLSAALAGNEVVAVYRDGVKIGTATVTGTSWSFTDGTGLTNGSTYSYTAQVEDAAGNTGPTSSAYGITLQTTGPATVTTITAVNDDQAPQTGAVANNGYTNDTTPQVQGTLSAALAAGETVVVMRNGVAVGTATVTGTTWTFEDTGLANGTSYTYTAHVEDAAANPGA